MIDPHGVVESGVGGARINQMSKPQLPDVPQSLELGRIDDSDGGGVQPDGIPERIPDHTELVRVRTWRESSPGQWAEQWTK